MKFYGQNNNILSVPNTKLNIIHKFGIIVVFIRIYNLLMETHTSLYCIM
jgi:hypothetical protein